MAAAYAEFPSTGQVAALAPDGRASRRAAGAARMLARRRTGDSFPLLTRIGIRSYATKVRTAGPLRKALDAYRSNLRRNPPRLLQGFARVLDRSPDRRRAPSVG